MSLIKILLKKSELKNCLAFVSYENYRVFDGLLQSGELETDQYFSFPTVQEEKTTNSSDFYAVDCREYLYP